MDSGPAVDIILTEPELKVLPTQPDHPAIPEEEGDDEDAHERVKADEESEGVEVRYHY